MTHTIIIAGGYDGDDRDDILEYHPEEDTITTVGHMIQARESHAVSVVQADDFLQWCQWPKKKMIFSRSMYSVIF